MKVKNLFLLINTGQKFMRKIIFAFLMIAFSSLSAQEKKPPDEKPFNGVYVGGNVGVLSHLASRNDTDGFLTDNSGWMMLDTNVTAGAQMGYDWQFCSKLIGIVADWNWTNNKSVIDDNINGGASNKIQTSFKWFTTIRARGGVTLGNTLLYLTTGAVVARFDTLWQDTAQYFNFDKTRWG